MFKRVLVLNFLIFMIKNYDCNTFSIDKEENSNSSSYNLPHEYFRVDAEKVEEKQVKPEIIKNQNQVINIMRNLLKKEIRKIKSSMTDSIMEEVINYYGKKLDLTDVLKQDIDNLNKKLNALNESNNNLSHNYKSIVKSHRILVDNFRNLINSRKESAPTIAIASTIKTPIRSNIITKTINNTRALNENMKKKSVDQNILKSFMTSTSRFVSKNQDSHQTSNKKLIDNNKSGNLDDASHNSATVFKIVHNENEITERIYDKQQKTRTEALNNNLIIKNNEPNDCQDLRDSGIRINGIYKVLISKLNQSIEVFCEFENGLGYTVIQSRFDGSVNFYENWNNYKNGFGNMNNYGEFWLGLEKIHLLTNQNDYSLQIKMTDWKDDEYIADYGSFKISDEQNKYKLEIDDFLKNSTTGDSLANTANAEQSHNNMPFSTFDSDNDMRFYDNCAQIFRSGWWFNACFQSNLNGLFSEENTHMKFLRNGIIWSTIDVNKSLKSTKMRIKRKNM